MSTVQVGGGLIAAGALLALAAVVFAPDPVLTVGYAERERQERNQNIATLVAALAGFTGAALVLVTNGWALALGAGAGAWLLYYVLLVIFTHSAQQQLLRQVLHERNVDADASGNPGRITVATAGYLGLITSAESPTVTTHFFGSHDSTGLGFAARAEEVARDRARLKWVLRHPYGVERPRPWRRAVGYLRQLRM